MNKHAVLHLTDVPYAYGINEETLFVRLRTAKGDLKNCEIYYKDRYDWENPFLKKAMELKKSDGLFDYYETTLEVDEKRFRYYFKLEDNENNVYYYNERGLHEKLKERLEPECFQFPYLCKADIYDSPEWVKNGIVYQIFPDRFCNGDTSNDVEGVLPWGEDVTSKSMFGGDLQGIIDKLDYLDDLGINIIYLTPIFLSSTNHKYNTADYYKIDPSFGDLEKAKELVQKCHEKGIKILLDAVFNHSGSDFFAFKDVIEKGDASKYRNWFFVEKYPVDTDKVNYTTFATDVSTMPKLNTYNPEVKKYLLEVAEYWIKEIGIDGWRLDVSDEVDHQFWKAFRKTVKAANPEAIIIGEIMHESSTWMKGDEMDGFMNYPVRELLLDFFARQAITADKFQEDLTSYDVLYMKEINENLFNLLGSHDTPRFLTECKEDIEKLKLSIAFQYTYIGLPYIYYGDEVGMTGATDPYCRGCMIWEEEKQNKDLLSFYKKMNSIRKTEKTLVHGEYINLYSEDALLVYKRVLDDKEILVILNNDENSSTLSLDGLQGRYIDLIEDKGIIIQRNIQLKGNDIKILKSIK